jgi:hypothetical protein
MIVLSESQPAAPAGDFMRLLNIVRSEFLEMPGLRLTGRQAQRLWALDVTTCKAILDTLEESRFLRRTRGGEYMLAAGKQ